jgi:hypothetical protein
MQPKPHRLHAVRKGGVVKALWKYERARMACEA